MAKKIKVIVKRVGKPVAVEKVVNTPKAMDGIIGGGRCYSWYPNLPDGVWILCKSAYKSAEIPLPNIAPPDGIIYGDFLMISEDENGIPASLTEKQIAECKEFISKAEAGGTKEGRGAAGVFLCER